MNQFSATKASQMVGVTSKLLPWQSFSNTCELCRDASAQIAGRQRIYCSKWHPGSWRHRAGIDFYPSRSGSGGPGLDLSHSKETTLILIQGGTTSTWFMCVWLLLKSVRCQHRRRVWPTCRAEFTFTSKWWTRQSHRNTALILHPAPFAPLVTRRWGLGTGREEPARDRS